MFISMHRISLIILLLTAFGAHAGTVYKWVDENGLTHYSESPPPDLDSATEFDLASHTQASNSADDDDYYSIQNQLQRVQEQRRAYLERQLLRKQILQESQSSHAEPMPPVLVERPVVVSGFRSHYGFGLKRQHGRHHDRPCGVGNPCGHHHKQPRGLRTSEPSKSKAFKPFLTR